MDLGEYKTILKMLLSNFLRNEIIILSCFSLGRKIIFLKILNHYSLDLFFMNMNDMGFQMGGFLK